MGHERLADSWVRYVGPQELVILINQRAEEEATQAPHELDGNALSIRRVAPVRLADARTHMDR
jgi:hypothetical protein